MGVSHLGTALQPHLPSFMTNNPLPQGFPWGPKTAKNTNYYYDPANTGVTRYYDWTVSRTTCAPDGVELDNACLLVNNQFPGPLIEANWGDWIEVKVTNDIPDEGTSIHWHGFLQKQTPWYARHVLEKYLTKANRRAGSTVLLASNSARSLLDRLSPTGSRLISMGPLGGTVTIAVSMVAVCGVQSLCMVPRTWTTMSMLAQ